MNNRRTSRFVRCTARILAFVWIFGALALEDRFGTGPMDR